MTNEEILETAAKNAAYIVELETELERSRAACAEMRDMLIRAAWLLRDASNQRFEDLRQEATRIEQKVHPLIDCGQGFVSPERVKGLVEALDSMLRAYNEMIVCPDLSVEVIARVRVYFASVIPVVTKALAAHKA